MRQFLLQQALQSVSTPHEVHSLMDSLSQSYSSSGCHLILLGYRLGKPVVHQGHGEPVEGRQEDGRMEKLGLMNDWRMNNHDHGHSHCPSSEI